MYQSILRFLVFLLLCPDQGFRAQTLFIHDRVDYPTLYPRDLETYLDQHPEAMLIDVRSPGEFSDTSRYAHLNIGRLKGAVNIPVDSLLLRPEQWATYFQGPAILYCSHSQRSRRACAALSSKVPFPLYNLNGGMTWMNHAPPEAFPGKEKWMEHHLPFQPIYANDLLPVLQRIRNLVIVDVRTAIAFDNLDTLDMHNIGRLKNAKNIPAKGGKIETQDLGPDKHTPILIYDALGNISPDVARQLVSEGYTDVYCLMGGLFAWTEHAALEEEEQRMIWENRPPYELINATQAASLLKQESSIIVLDTRTEAEFQNKATEPWRSIGRLRHAVHLPREYGEELPSGLPDDKHAVLLVYGSDPMAFRWSRRLCDAGYSKVYCLVGGLWSMVYTYANVPGYEIIRECMEMTEGKF